jgi:hypothetical protein
LVAVKPMVYVIMPVGSDPRHAHRRAAIEAVVRESGLAPYFPADGVDSKVSFDLVRARRELRRARLVLADLTLERPSCYYEVGLAQALGRQVQLLAEAGTPIHQAHGRENTIFYGNLEELAAELRPVLAALRGPTRQRQPVAP